MTLFAMLMVRFASSTRKWMRVGTEGLKDASPKKF
jgi:hypothetical protein